jgi:hypothetical protein
MSNKKQSSVELFAIALYEGGYLQGNGDEINDLLERHKALHKEEMIKVWIDAYTTNMKSPTRDNFILWAENYYEQTYGGKK